MNKFAITSFAVVLLGSSAAFAQVYNGPTPGYCGPATANVTNWILDPATGQPITESQYLSRYPSNPATWTYNCTTGLWTDPGPQAAYAAPQAQYSERDRGRDGDRDRARDNRDRDNRDRDDHLACVIDYLAHRAG